MSGRFLLDTNIVIALFANEKVVKENLARIEDFAGNSIVLGCDTETSRMYGEIKYELSVKGHPIPENDIWIAAIAIQHDLILISRDAHFKEVDNLKVITW